MQKKNGGNERADNQKVKGLKTTRVNPEVHEQLRSKKEVSKNIDVTSELSNSFILNALPDGISVMDKADEVILHVNQRLLDMMGYRANELVGQHISKLHPEEFFEDMRQNIDLIKHTPHERVTEVPMLRKNGTVFYCDVVNIEFMVNGKPAICGFFRDVVENLSAIQKIEFRQAQIQQKMLHRAQEVGHLGQWEFCPSTNEFVWSDETYTILGAQKPEGGKNSYHYSQFVHPEDLAAFTGAYENHLISKIPFEHQHRLVALDGKEKLVRVTCDTAFMADGQPEYSFGVIADLTAWKEAEARLQYEQDYNAAIVQSLPDLLFIIGFDGVFKDVKFNPNIHKRVKPEDYIGKNIVEALPAAIAQRIATLLPEVKAGKVDNTFTFDWTEPDGEQKFFSVRFTPFGSDDLMCLLRDITKERLQQYEVYERERELNFLFNNMAQGVVYQDAQGAITHANKAAQEILGLTLGQMQGKTSIDPDWYAIKSDGTPFPGEEHPAMVALKTGKPVVNVEMGVHHPGTKDYQWILISATPEFEPGSSAPHRVFATFTNITFQKTYERELKNTYDLLAQAGQIAEVGVYDFNPITKNLYWSPALKKIFGVSEDFEPDWDRAFSFFEAEHKTILENLAKKTVSTGAPFDIEVSFSTREGEKKWARVIGKANIENGTVVRFFGSFQNITKQRHNLEILERQSTLQNLLLEVSNTYISIREDALDENLQKSMAELGAFVGADRFYIFDYDWVKVTASNSYEWCAEGIEPQIEYLQDIPVIDMEDWTINHKAGRPFIIPDVLALPQDSYTRSILEPQGIKSLISMPLMVNGACVGFIGLDFVTDFFHVSKVEERLLKVFADLLSQLKERFKTQSELKERREFLTDLFEKSQSVIFQKDCLGHYKMVNLRFEKIMNVNRLEALGKTDLELFPKEVAEMIMANDQVVLKEGKNIQIEEQVVLQDGSVHYLHSSKFPVKDAAGKTIGIAGMSVDLTQRKLAEINLKNSEERFKSIFEGASAPMLLIDLDTKQIIDSNAAAQSLYGFDKEEFLTKTLFDTNTSVRFVYQKLADLKLQKKTKGETTHRKKSGDEFDVEIFSSLLQINGRQVVHEIVEDISERKHYLNTIEKQNEIFRDIAWTQSHIVRAPLARLMGLVEILQSEDFDIMPKEMLVQEIKNSAGELDGVVKEISEKTYFAEKLINQLKE